MVESLLLMCVLFLCVFGISDICELFLAAIMNTNRGGQGSSSSAGQDAPRRGISEAGGNRDQRKSPGASRPAVNLNRDALRKSLAQKKQVSGSSTTATADKSRAAVTAASGQAAATGSKGQASAERSSSSRKGKEKRRLEDASRPPRPTKVTVTGGSVDTAGSSGSGDTPVEEIPLGDVYVPAWNIRQGSSVVSRPVASEMFEHCCIITDLQQLSAQGLHVVAEEFASAWAKVDTPYFMRYFLNIVFYLTFLLMCSWLLWGMGSFIVCTPWRETSVPPTREKINSRPR